MQRQPATHTASHTLQRDVAVIPHRSKVAQEHGEAAKWHQEQHPFRSAIQQRTNNGMIWHLGSIFGALKHICRSSRATLESCGQVRKVLAGAYSVRCALTCEILAVKLGSLNF